MSAAESIIETDPDCPICRLWDVTNDDAQDPAGAPLPRNPAMALDTFALVDRLGGTWHDPRAADL